MLTWILRYPSKYDANELSKLRIKIDGETENLDREPGEGLLTPEDFEKLIYEDRIAEKNMFLVADVEGKIVGFTRLEVVRYGKYYNRQRYKCKGCNKTFSDFTHTTLYKTKHPEKWIRFIGCMKHIYFSPKRVKRRLLIESLVNEEVNLNIEVSAKSRYVF